MLTSTAILFDARIQNEALTLYNAGYAVTILSIEDQKLINSLGNAQQVWESFERHMKGIPCKRYFLRTRTWEFLPRPVRMCLQAIELAIKFSMGVLANKASVYHCHDLIPAAFCWIGKWIYKARIVYDAHELETEATAASGFEKRFLQWYETQMIRRSDLVITVNEAISRIMESMYAVKVNVIHNRPSTLVSPLDRTKLRRMMSFADNHRIVMYVGFLALDRGIDMLVTALKFLPSDVHVVIMGTGRIAEFKSLINDITTNHMIEPGRVHFIGPFPPQEVVHYLCGADISTMLYQNSSDNNLFNAPNKLYQSIMAQVPLLTSNNESFPPLVEPSDEKRIGMSVDERDPVAIANGIKFLLNQNIQILCRMNLVEAAQDISWNNEGVKLTRYYKTLLSETI